MTESYEKLNTLLSAVDSVLMEALDGVGVHPCDENNDDIKSKHLCDAMAKLYKARKDMGYDTDSANKCECHERDSSYVCEYCYSKGLRGTMQRS